MIVAEVNYIIIEISNPKQQITNNTQIPSVKIQNNKAFGAKGVV